MEEIHQEMQLLSFTSTTGPPPPPPPFSSHPPRLPWPPQARFENFHGPSLDLQLSISFTPLSPSSDNNCNSNNNNNNDDKNSNTRVLSYGDFEIETLKWQAAQQLQLAAIERVYAERVMELARREIEMAQSEFGLARSLWKRARDEVEKAESMKERAFRNVGKDPMCIEVTCLCCSQKFRP